MQPNNNREKESDTMDQTEYLKLSNNGKTVIGCQKNYKKDVVIPNGVEKIGVGAFKNHLRITSIEIPNSVTEIEDEAFLGCNNLSSIKLMNI